MNRNKLMSIVAITVAVAFLTSSIAIASPVFAKKGSSGDNGGGSSSGSSSSSSSSSGSSAAAVAAVHPIAIMIVFRNVFLMLRQVVLQQNSR